MKTIRLLSTYNGYKPGSIISVEDAVANQLLPINATLDLNGGTPAFQPSPSSGLSTGTNLPPAQTLTTGQTSTVTLPAGASIAITGSPDISGTREVLNPDGTTAENVPLQAGRAVIGVFTADTKIRMSVAFGTLTTRPSTALGVEDAPLYVSSATLTAGEDQDRDWQTFVNGANLRKPVPSGSLDLLLGVTGAPGDFLERLDYTVLAAGSSQIVIREGQTAPVLSIATHATTASTTTAINTAINPVAVAANQFKDCLMKVGGEYRHVLAHAAFAAGAVNAYTLDRALAAAPAAGAPVAIENRNYVYELIPFGVAAGPYSRNIQQACTQAGWRITTGDGVRIQATGDFT